VKVFEVDEWRRNVLPRLVKLCAIENIGTSQKRSTRASREAISNCVKRYARQLVQKKIAEIRGQVESIKSELGL